MVSSFLFLLDSLLPLLGGPSYKLGSGVVVLLVVVLLGVVCGLTGRVTWEYQRWNGCSIFLKTFKNIVALS